MGSAYLYYENTFNYALRDTSVPPPGPANVWRDSPTFQGIIIYSIVTPILCLFGLCANTLSLMVLKRKELTGSIYVYLTMLAAMDLLMCFVLFYGGLSRGALYFTPWASYDAIVGLPVSGAINTVSVIATVGVTIDRVLFLWNPMQGTKPKFCNPKVAKCIMFVAIIVALVLNVPYCFIFEFDDDGELGTTQFFDSNFYVAFNWFMLIIFSVIPAIVLIIGNGFLVMSLKKANKICTRCHGKPRDHTNLTITLISITVLFVATEIPSSLLSRTKTIILLFNGDYLRGNSRALETSRVIWTLIGAINITTNFIFYCLFCPAFVRTLKKVLKIKPRDKFQSQLDVFVVKKPCEKRRAVT